MSRRPRAASCRVAGRVTAAGALFALVAVGAAANADNLQNDVSTTSGDTRTVAAGQTTTVYYYIDNTNSGGGSYASCDAADGSPVTVNILPPAGVTATPSSLSFDACGNATTNTKAVQFSSSTPGTYIINHNAMDEVGNYNANSAKFTLDVTAAAPPPADNQAPVVLAAAMDQTGNEGSELTASGAFTDDGGASNLTITKLAGDGDVIPGADGTWSWSFTPEDNFLEQSVTVRATDKNGLFQDDTFTWTSLNVDPALGAIELNRMGACAVSLSAAFSDAGLADTHTGAILWGDEQSGTDPTLVDVTSPITGSHTYVDAGTYIAEVTVTDDDGGSGTGTASSFKAYNTPSAILQPINASGTRSSFKIGSTIPVKITVTGCDGLPNGTLTPAVNLEKYDTTADVAVNESSVSETPTNGTNMRWDPTAQQYIYNLSTKLSQFTGGALTAGTWTVSVDDPSFEKPVKAAFDLKK